MPGIGGQNALGRMVTVQTELPADVDSIVEAIRKIILLGEVQSIVVKTGEPIVYQRFIRNGEEISPEESTQSFAELTAYEIIRNIVMEEWSADEGESPHTTLVLMFAHMAENDWVVTHIVLGEDSDFWRWLRLPAKADQNFKQFCGARIEKSKELPKDAFILCGSKTRHATIAEIGFALKGAAYEQRTNTESN